MDRSHNSLHTRHYDTNPPSLQARQTTDATSPLPPTFIQCRTAAWLLLALIDMLWVVLICFDIYWLWDTSSSQRRILIASMLLTSVITSFGVLMLLAVQFRIWLDAARCFFFLITHIGSAVSCSYWFSIRECPRVSASTHDTCELFNIYLLIASWVASVVLLSYTIGFAYACYAFRPTSVEVMHTSKSWVGPKLESQDSLVDIHQPAACAYPADCYQSSRKSSRLSKPLPDWLY